MKYTIGWNVFYVADLYDTGQGEHKCMMHGTRAKARDQMRKMKAQPWTFSSVFICRVVLEDGKIRYEKTR